MRGRGRSPNGCFVPWCPIAPLVLLDLTAVDLLDRESASALRRMLTAIEMLGSRPILTGINPKWRSRSLEAMPICVIWRWLPHCPI